MMGGYLHRSNDPPPGNEILWNGHSALSFPAWIVSLNRGLGEESRPGDMFKRDAACGYGQSAPPDRPGQCPPWRWPHVDGAGTGLNSAAGGGAAHGNVFPLLTAAGPIGAPEGTAWLWMITAWTVHGKSGTRENLDNIA